MASSRRAYNFGAHKRGSFVKPRKELIHTYQLKYAPSVGE
jgi:hypothetical protein